MNSLDALILKSGGHSSVEDGLCAMEAVAWLAGEPHSDRPQCASPVLAAYVRSLNDSMPDDERQKLKPFVERLIGTANPALDQQRANILAWASIIAFAPTALYAIGLVDHAETLRNLKQYDWASAQSAAWSAKSAAWSAAESAAKSAAWSAKSAAWAAESAAKSAAWSAAESAAWSAAESAAKSAESAGKKASSIWDLALLALDQALEVKA